MRFYLSTLSLILLPLALPLQASPAESIPGADGVETLEMSSEDVRTSGWNQWVCQAYGQGNFRPFTGVSYFFREGSGEGQQARSLAHLSALRRCEFRTGQQCRSRLESDCRVRRY